MTCKQSNKKIAPKWDTPEYINWKMSQFEQAVENRQTDKAAWERMWDEFRALLRELPKEEDFWHADHALTLLPHLLAVKQYLDKQNRFFKRMEAGIKGAETRNRKKAA